MNQTMMYVCLYNTVFVWANFASKTAFYENVCNWENFRTINNSCFQYTHLMKFQSTIYCQWHTHKHLCTTYKHTHILYTHKYALLHIKAHTQALAIFLILSPMNGNVWMWMISFMKMKKNALFLSMANWRSKNIYRVS